MGANRTEIFNVKRLVAPITYMVQSGDDMLDIDTSSGGLTTIYIPNIVENGLNLSGKTFTINDISNNASVGNINIVCLGGDTINNFTSLSLSTDGISTNIVQVDRTRYLATTNVAGGTSVPLMISVTYTGLVSLITANALMAGQQYLITDFQTIYDQPDYDVFGNSKPTVSTLSGGTEPLIVKAVTNNTISNLAFSTVYPSDHILYDWTFQTTEYMAVNAKGRITERVSYEDNNRTNYDHRVVLFKRYDNGSGAYDQINDNGNPSLDFYTFNGGENNYIGNTPETLIIPTPFYLPNNIFQSISVNNTIANYCYNNTVIGEFKGNFIGDNFNNNVITLAPYSKSFAFDNNNIGNVFRFNQINLLDDFLSNNIGNYFQYNLNINGNFSYNHIGNGFSSNTNIGTGFVGNIIGNNFSSNVDIAVNFQYNQIGNGFQGNTNIGNDFSSNQINNNFQGNTDIGANFASNHISNGFSANSTIGNTFASNHIGNGFNSNTNIGDYFQNNQIGDSFSQNDKIGNNFQNNVIGYYFSGNSMIDTNFSDNQIGTNFNGNDTIGNGFANNVIGNYFEFNTTIGNDFSQNYIGFAFEYNNTIGNNFSDNQIENGFSYNFQIFDNFQNNQIGNYFQSNSYINPNFNGNVIGSYFKSNIDILTNFRQNNIISDNVLGYSFSLSTYVYGNYTKNIIRGNAGTLYLEYFDEGTTNWAYVTPINS